MFLSLWWLYFGHVTVYQCSALCILAKVSCFEFTKVKHVVPALTEDVPGFGKQLVKPLGHSHGKQRHHKHGVDASNETLSFFGNDLIQATNSGLEQHRGNTYQEIKELRKEGNM